LSNNGTASGGSGSRLLVTATGRSDVRPGFAAGGWKTCRVPRRAWLDSKIDVFLEELAASGMHLDRHRAGELITGHVRALAALMRITEATARSYLGDEIIKDMARRMLFEVAGERPGADLMEAPRTVPLPLALVGITVAALAEAMQVRAANEPAAHLGDVITTYAQALSGFGQITAGAAPGQAGNPAEILFPPALLRRAARYIGGAADLAVNGGNLPDGIPETARNQLAATLRRDADGADRDHGRRLTSRTREPGQFPEGARPAHRCLSARGTRREYETGFLPSAAGRSVVAQAPSPGHAGPPPCLSGTAGSPR
jgi:hypothetical protein